MIKNNVYKLIAIISIIVFITSGCGLYGFEEEQPVNIDAPPVTLELDNNDTSLDLSDLDTVTQVPTQNNDQATETFTATIYFMDDNGDVVPLSMDIPKVEGIGQQVLSYMTIGGPVESLLPTGFKPVIPAGTKFTMRVESNEKLAVIDFSKEFLNYQASSPQDEKKILDAITWSVTEFPTVDKVEITVNGYPLTEMPVFQTPVVSPLSRIDGINLEFANNINIGQTTPIVLYFTRSSQNFNYLVPVTRLIPKTDNIAKATIEQLITGPRQGSNLTSSLLPTTKLLSVKVSDQLLIADFDEEVMGFDNNISNDVIDMLVWSLTENTNIPTIQIKVKGQSNNFSDDLSKPILKPEEINATIF